jgi:TBC1 domain family protein 5
MALCRKMLMDVLFCYSKEHSNLGYRQGMHELLAPIIFVLDSDKRDEDDMKSVGPEAVEMNVIMDPGYIENDSFILLEALMETCEIWYFQKVDIKELEIRQNAQQPLFTNQERAEIMSSPLAKKLERIQTKLLREHDPTLAVHLENLGIAPQVYGIRWIRLLFGREFPLDGLLVVWDAIFAYSPSLSLVDYLCVAMLQFIRDILIGHDYPTCMQQLMRFPIVGDTHYLIEKALHLRNPKIYPEPLSWQYQMTETGDGSLLEPLPRAGRLGRVGKTITSKAKAGARHLIPKRSSGHYEADQDQTSVSKSRSPRKPFGKGNKKVSGNSTEDYWSRKSPGIAVADEQAAAGRRPSSPVDYSGLQKELDNKETLCLYCGNKMDSFIDQLQDDLLQLSLPRQQEDSIFVSLAGLKQVRDLLKGTLKLSGTVPEMEIESLTRRSPQRNNNSNPFGVTPEPTDDIIDRSEPVELSSDPFCADTTNSDKASNEQSDVSGQISRQSPAVSKENSPAVEDDRFVVV